MITYFVSYNYTYKYGLNDGFTGNGVGNGCINVKRPIRNYEDIKEYEGKMIEEVRKDNPDLNIGSLLFSNFIKIDNFIPEEEEETEPDELGVDTDAEVSVDKEKE